MVKSEWPVAQLPTALAEISTEELNSFSPLENVSILPGRVHKGRCGTLWTPGVWVSAPEQAGNAPCLLQSAGHKRGPLMASAVSVVQSHTPS